MRSYEECKQIANKLRNGEIEKYPIEVIDRDGVIVTIVFLTFGLDGDMGFWKVDKIRDDVYHLSSDKAIELIFNHEKPIVYALQTK